MGRRTPGRKKNMTDSTNVMKQYTVIKTTEEQKLDTRTSLALDSKTYYNGKLHSE